jgi:hypothetical protein
VKAKTASDQPITNVTQSPLNDSKLSLDHDSTA